MALDDPTGTSVSKVRVPRPRGEIRCIPGTEPGRPFVKPVPPELFDVYGTCAEMRWEAMRGRGYHVPNDRFFVRNHTSTPLIDVDAWRLRVHGSGLRSPRDFTYDELLALPARTMDVAIECAGNGRAFFASQQGLHTPGTPWRLGAIGVARWRGVPLAAILALAGLREDAVDVLPSGLDPEYVHDGVNLGHVRRPLPIAKVLDDVLLAYEMNDERLPLDHGFPARLIVPGWTGIASIKWLGAIEVSTTPLASPWSTDLYRMLGPGQSEEPLTTQVVKSAFELPWNATLQAGRRHILRGRSWSGNGRVVKVEVSVDGGRSWLRALIRGRGVAAGWAPWHIAWFPEEPGPYVLQARATDETGATQPSRTACNTLGYLYDGIVGHPVTVTEDKDCQERH
ncbi:sulfite oxidase [Microtetraspora sp. NBRC 16547]|uniref:sulfite oxidase n=1 Tax=Microtetraspora sp. NBRC 16547 TaxID=3030993 RepID=UPI00249FDC24|nr:sulfite oxidase [Microtetraspora sp. NBRC 16547]GLW96818.1 sulfite oxidase [Microtetraspora sp. NBRC 16547]